MSWKRSRLVKRGGDIDVPRETSLRQDSRWVVHKYMISEA